jgi:hypothetical protein
LLLWNVCYGILPFDSRFTNMTCFFFLTDPTSVLCYPRLKNPAIPNGLRSKIIATLCTRYNTRRTIISRHFAVQEVEFWGKFRRLGGGDTMRAAAVCQSNAEDRREATYVRVCTTLLFL